MHVEIKEACQENWELMSPREKGRHCAKCEKVVTDFTRFTDEQIINYLHNHTNTCGRFDNTQLKRNMELPPLVNPWTNWWKRLSLGGMLFGSSTLALAQNATKDSLDRDTIKEQFEFEVKEKLRTVSCLIHAPQDSTKVIQQVRFEFGEFQTDISNETDWMTFMIPKNVTTDSLKIILTQADSSTQLLEVEPDFYSPTLQNAYVLTFDSIWVIAPFIAPGFISIIDTEVITTAGVVPDIEYLQVFDSVKWNNVVWGFTTLKHLSGDNGLLCDSLGNPMTGNHNNNDSGDFSESTKEQLAELKEQKEVFKEVLVHEKRSSSIWWWLLPVSLVFLIAGWQWKKKRSQEPIS